MEQGNQTKGQAQNKKERALSDSFFFWIAVFLFFVAGDQLVKYLVFKNAGGFRNYAFAFSLPVPVGLMYLIYAAVLGAIIFYLARNYKSLSAFSKFSWTLVLSGAVSNIVERIVLGSVRDFIYISFYRWTGIYNPADFFILAGIVLLLLPRKAKPE